MLAPAETERMESLVARFFHDTRWEAAKGFELTERIKVLISAQASMLLLGLDIDDYAHVSRSSSTRRTVRLRGPHPTGGGTWSTATQHLAGQARYRGPVVLSWAAARRGAAFPDAGENVVYHEFAHQLDMLDGVTDGTPPLDDEAARRRWVEVCTRAYDTVRAEGRRSCGRTRGRTPPSSSPSPPRCSSTGRWSCAEHEPELFDELRFFYGQDPAARWRRAAAR